jgi:hypothetical protein
MPMVVVPPTVFCTKSQLFMITIETPFGCSRSRFMLDPTGRPPSKHNENKLNKTKKTKNNVVMVLHVALVLNGRYHPLTGGAVCYMDRYTVAGAGTAGQPPTVYGSHFSHIVEPFLVSSRTTFSFCSFLLALSVSLFFGISCFSAFTLSMFCCSLGSRVYVFVLFGRFVSIVLGDA